MGLRCSHLWGLSVVTLADVAYTRPIQTFTLLLESKRSSSELSIHQRAKSKIRLLGFIYTSINKKDKWIFFQIFKWLKDQVRLSVRAGEAYF